MKAVLTLLICLVRRPFKFKMQLVKWLIIVVGWHQFYCLVLIQLIYILTLVWFTGSSWPWFEDDCKLQNTWPSWIFFYIKRRKWEMRFTLYLKVVVFLFCLLWCLQLMASGYMNGEWWISLFHHHPKQTKEKTWMTDWEYRILQIFARNAGYLLIKVTW